MLQDDVNSQPVLKGPEVSRQLFGGVLDFDAAGHYPGLELLNLIFCCDSELILPSGEEVKVTRRSHDLARRLVWDPNFEADKRRHSVLLDDENAESTLRELFRCLQLEIPSGTKEPTWTRAHFFPYTSSLIHWDSRERGNKISLERLYLRGGGSLAFKILRFDPDEDRLTRIRIGLENLYTATKDSPLDVLASFVNLQSYSDANATVDEIEKSSSVVETPFFDTYRNGVQALLEQEHATSVSKVRSLMGWTSIWLVLMQNRQVQDKLGKSTPIIICDCGADNPQLKKASQRCLQDAMNDIITAVKSIEPNLPNAQQNKIKSFFWATAAANGFLNAWKGRKHFTLSIDALEVIVLATVPTGTQMPFERFVQQILYERLGIAIGRGAAEDSGLIQSIDASIFEENEAQLAIQMVASGLVTQYSDATRMVSPKPTS